MRGLHHIKGKHGLLFAPGDSFIEFPDGIPGFTHEKSWVIVEYDSPIFWLQSTESPDVALPVVIPWIYRPDYEAKVSDKDLEVIELQSPSDVEVLSVVNVRERSSAINLFSPVVINRRLMLGAQVVNQAEGYSTRDPLLRVGDPRPVDIIGWDFPRAYRA